MGSFLGVPDGKNGPDGVENAHSVGFVLQNGIETQNRGAGRARNPSNTLARRYGGSAEAGENAEIA
jgi:hypothetical protein